MYLALDQSPKRIGWSMGFPAMLYPMTGIEPLPMCGPRHAEFLEHARDWLRGMFAHHVQIDNVIVENAFMGNNPEVFARSAKLIGAIELECLDSGVRCREVQADDWRKHFIGYCRAPKTLSPSKRRMNLKDAAMRACVERDWLIKGEDDAEACGILDFALCIDFPEYAAKGRLFA